MRAFEECHFAFISNIKSDDTVQKMKASTNEMNVPKKAHKKPPINPAVATPMYMNVFIAPRAMPFSLGGTALNARAVLTKQLFKETKYGG